MPATLTKSTTIIQCASGEHVVSASRPWPREGQAHVAGTRAGNAAHAVWCGSTYTLCGRIAARVLTNDYAAAMAMLILAGGRCEACASAWWAARRSA